MGFQDRDYNRGEEGRYNFMDGMRGMSVVRWLLTINIGIFFLDMFLGEKLEALGHFSIEAALSHFQVWRWFTYQFLHSHGNLLHIVFNMIALFFFGPLLEQWWGSKRFLAFYLLCGISGAWLFSVIYFVAPSLLNIEAVTPLIGASGSIFGIFAGAAVIAPHQKVMLIFPPIELKMRTLVLILMGVALFTLVTSGPNAGGEAAHLGGAMLGFLLVRRPWALDFVDEYFGEKASVRRQALGEAKRRRDREALEEEVDRILAKVKEQGLHSLTRAEKRTLQRASERNDRNP